MKHGAKTRRILELHAQGLWNAEIAKRVPCSPTLVHNVLDQRGLTRHRMPTDDEVSSLQAMATAVRDLASAFAEKTDTSRREVALCLADAACEIERGYQLLTAQAGESK